MRIRLNVWLKASTLVEVLVAMALAGILLLAVYDGLEILSSGINRIDDSDDYERLDWLEHFEILEFRCDSVKRVGDTNVFYLCDEPIDTLVIYGF